MYYIRSTRISPSRFHSVKRDKFFRKSGFEPSICTHGERWRLWGMQTTLRKDSNQDNIKFWMNMCQTATRCYTHPSPHWLRDTGFVFFCQILTPTGCYTHPSPHPVHDTGCGFLSNTDIKTGYTHSSPHWVHHTGFGSLKNIILCSWLRGSSLWPSKPQVKFSDK